MLGVRGHLNFFLIRRVKETQMRAVLVLLGVEVTSVGLAVVELLFFLEMTVKQEGHTLDTLQQCGEGKITHYCHLSNMVIH